MHFAWSVERQQVSNVERADAQGVAGARHARLWPKMPQNPTPMTAVGGAPTEPFTTPGRLLLRGMAAIAALNWITL